MAATSSRDSAKVLSLACHHGAWPLSWRRLSHPQEPVRTITRSLTRLAAGELHSGELASPGHFEFLSRAARLLRFEGFEGFRATTDAPRQAVDPAHRPVVALRQATELSRPPSFL